MAGNRTSARSNGDSINRSELFDEADLDAALAHGSTSSAVRRRRLENAASRAYERFHTYFAARDWDAMAEMLADDTITADDRRRVVGAGIRRGRDARDRATTRATADRRGHESDVGRRCDPRGAPRPQSYPLLRAAMSGRMRSTPRRSTSSRSTPTIGSRHASRSTSTTSTPPSRSSTPGTSRAKPPPTLRRGLPSRGSIRQIQPTGASRNNNGLRPDLRPSAARNDRNG